MKIPNVPGDFASKCLYRAKPDKEGELTTWYMSVGYYFSMEEAIAGCGAGGKMDIKWPLEIKEDELIYVPAEKEWKV